MAVKSKVKPKSKTKSTPKVKAAVKKTKPVAKAKAKTVPAAKKAAAKKASPKAKAHVETASAVKVTARKKRTSSTEAKSEVTRTINLSGQIRQPAKSSLRKSAIGSANSNPFNFMKAPRTEYAFEVGDIVEVFCDHEKGRDRVRGWIKGIVVQVDNKMVAVQFRSNVFLTDGWMVPDRILWYPLNSEHIRPSSTGKKTTLKKDVIPDY